MSKTQDANNNVENTDKLDQTTKQELHNNETVNESLMEDSDIEEVELLKFTDSKNLYLTKVGLVFCFYYFVCSLVLTLIYVDQENFRQKYFQYRIFHQTWTYLYIIIGIKIVMSFLGSFIRGLSIIFFLIDCYLINIFVVSLHFYFEGYLQTMYKANGFFILAVSYMLLASSIGFVISAIVKDNKRGYNFILGILLMTGLAGGALIVAVKLFATHNFNNTHLMMIIGAVIIYNIYFSVNSYQVITFRTEKFYDDEFSYCFFCYFTDWFTFFWVDLFRDASFHRIKQKAEYLSRANFLKQKKLAKLKGFNIDTKNKKADSEAKNDIEVPNVDNSF